MTTRSPRPRSVRATTVCPCRVTVRWAQAVSAASTASVIACSLWLTDSMSTSWRVSVTTSAVRSRSGTGSHQPWERGRQRAVETELELVLVRVLGCRPCATASSSSPPTAASRPAALAKAAEDRGFDTIYVPEHTHIPVKRTAAHPGTGDETLPDDRYLRTLDPWISLATCAAVTSKIGLSTAVALPVESDPITLAKTIATLDHLSGGRVSIGAGFGWNTDELEDHHVPPGKRRTVLKEYVEAMRALWTQEEASYDGEFVQFGPRGPTPSRPSRTSR